MKETKAMFMINILKAIIEIYFDTFFVFYFFKVANYEVILLAKYYLTVYLFIGLGFILIRKAMKRNVKVPFFRIGISLQAVFIALIMLLKEHIINYIFIVAIVKGIADGFYHFPKNILNTEKISNEGRQRFDGIVNIITKLISIIIPLVLGILLTYFNYVEIGKVVFVLFLIIFLISFDFKDKIYVNKNVDLKGFKKIVNKNHNVKLSMWVPFLAGFTYSSGVMGFVITLSKINNFKTNLNLGFVDSLCGILSLIVATIFALKLKEKNFKKTLLFSGIFSFITLILFAFFPTKWTLICYLIVRYTLVLIINKISDVVVTNLSNSKELKEEYKTEFYLIRDLIFSVSRCTGYLALFIICLFVGMNYISYLMIVCALAILCEAIVVSKIIKE